MTLPLIILFTYVAISFVAFGLALRTHHDAPQGLGFFAAVGLGLLWPIGLTVDIIRARRQQILERQLQDDEYWQAKLALGKQHNNRVA